ncbi:glycoside hydrolase family 28 protein [Leeuwenhoekiella sp. W20_SRS_FM14]|uniref:glycoside hydrolase family 28 protein n=1 Tax=Leeuwenhoekiella sp. W20_SRS_FM14 TaxID=3240270 RepID=UPI003F945CE3
MKIKNKLVGVLLIFQAIIFAQDTATREFSILDFGAVADGKTLNTAPIQAAIDKAFEQNGGTVVFPKGTFLTGSLVLKSNVHIEIEEGGVLLGSTSPQDYKKLDMPGRPVSPKKDDNSQLALLLAYKAKNIKITGKGKVDGQGLKLALAIDSLHHAGIDIDTQYNYRRNRPNETKRPKLIRFSQCEEVSITDLSLGAAACWGLSFELTENLILDNLKIVNRAYWNNDGIDITDCKNVSIINCDLNTADDGICLKSYYPDYANDGILIKNCTIRSSASAIKFGSASYGGFKNVTIDSIQVYDTFRSAIALESVDGAAIENIQISNITAKNTGNALFIRLGNRSGEQPGSVKNVSIKNMLVEVPFGRPDMDYDLRGPEVDFFHNPFPASIVGLEDAVIENVKLENITVLYPGNATKGMGYIPLSRLEAVPEERAGYPEFSMFGELPAWGLYVRHAKNLKLKNINFALAKTDFRPAFVFDDVSQLQLENIMLPYNLTHQIALKNVKPKPEATDCIKKHFDLIEQ